MPEVVEVALTAHFLDEQLKGKNIKKINVLGGRYSRHGLSGLSNLKAILPLKIVRVDSKGKFLWFELRNSDGNDYYILNTFGLEGKWDFKKEKHSGVGFELTDGRTLYFTDQRNFGTLMFTSLRSKLTEKWGMLGPDLLKEEFTDNEFHDRIKDYLLNKNGKVNTRKKDKEIVKVLMDQSTELGSGLGNYLAVEALFRAKISPHKTIYEIYNNKELSDSLSEAIKYVIKLSFMTADIGYLGDLSEDMETYVKKLRRQKNRYHRDIKLTNSAKFKFNVYRKKKDPDGNSIKAEKDIIKGRTTYWSPKIQT